MSAVTLTVIAVLGLHRARKEPASVATALPSAEEYLRTYVKFLGLTIINPLTVVYFAAFVLGLGLARELDLVDGALFATGAFLASLSWQTLLAGLGAAGRRRLPRRFQVGAVVAGNLLVLAMAAWIILR